MPIVASPSVSCPRDGSKWYTCSSHSMFVGCCKHNPCRYGCEEGYVGPALLTEEAFGILPDASCSTGSNFYSCDLGDRNQTYFSNETYYWGCCKSNACLAQPAPGCRMGDIGMAFMKYSKELEQYIQVQQQLPVTDFSGTWADKPPTMPSIDPKQARVSRSKAQTLIGMSLALLVLLPAMMVLWISCRRLISSSMKRSSKAERTPLPLSPAASKAGDKETTPRSASQDVNRMGSLTTHVFSATSVVIFGVCGFLSFLWGANHTNASWNSIMINNWVTRAVSISALFLRTAVDFQAATASAMLASLLLESSAGIHPYHLAVISPMRSGTTGPWSLAQYVYLELWRSTKTYKKYLNWVAITITLLTTTIILQFSSTILLSDLKPGPLGGYDFQTEIRPGLSYKNIFQRITRDAAWTSNPPFYPAFGEYTEPSSTVDGISDTGPLLRAFLPYATAESRQSLRSYTGKSLVLDARVSCQAPSLKNFKGSDHYSEVTGTISASRPANMLQNIVASEFACAIAGPNEFSICQLGQTFPGFIGSLNSSFENSTSYGTAFLVAKGTNSSSESASKQRSEWLDITFTNQTDLGASFSICFAPWDASILEIALTSASNRTEPLLQWWKSFTTTAVLNQLLPNSDRKTERPILQMRKPHSLLGDLPPKRERPLVQSDASGSSAAAYGSNTPLPENWSIFLTGEPIITLLNHFYRTPSRAISADPALAAIFNDMMATTGSVAWAMSSLITVLSMTNYYSQLPAFDRLETVKVSFFTNVLYPRDNLGIILLFWALVAHYIVVVTIVVLFVNKTQLTLLGNAWSAFSQLAGSTDVKECIGDSGLKDDSTVLKELSRKENANLRARLVRRGDVAEFSVE